jgi:hypothetical protein
MTQHIQAARPAFVAPVLAAAPSPLEVARGTEVAFAYQVGMPCPHFRLSAHQAVLASMVTMSRVEGFGACQ